MYAIKYRVAFFQSFLYILFALAHSPRGLGYFLLIFLTTLFLHEVLFQVKANNNRVNAEINSNRPRTLE